MRSRNVVVALLVVVSLCMSYQSFAAGGRNKGGGNAKINKQNKQDKTGPSVWLVSSVDTSTNTITVQTSEGKETKVYKVTSFTTVMVNGQPGKLTDVTSGMKIDMVIGGDGKSLSSITASNHNTPMADTGKAKRKQKK